MFVIFILLWLIAILLIYANPKTPWAWWGSGCLILNGFGGVAVIFKDDIIPFAEQYNNDKLYLLCLLGKGAADILQHYLATYALICFVLFLTNFLDLKIQNNIKGIIVILLSIPSILMFILYPLTPYFEPDYKILSAWVVLYTLASIIILVISILKENDSQKKYNKIVTSVFAIPTTLGIMWTSYLSVAVGYHEVWYLNIWIILFQFVVFVYLAVKHGILGVRFKVERVNLDETIDTMINGMSMVSHAIKNEASTINLCVDTIRSVEAASPGTERKLSIIKESCKNLTEFTHKINKFRTMEMDIEPYFLKILVEKAVEQVLPLTYGKKIEIVNKIKDDATIMIDAIHISEVIRNLLINAIEAIENEGLIYVYSEIKDQKFCISIVDNGVGIQREALEKVMTPFYSTKKGKNNFGLGLSYCYKVMSSHNGNLKINSAVNKGTTMSLLFPLERVLKVSNKATQ
ncbi:MAG: histidine kinase [Eubacterium sp.]|jgi:signal transduction histidine kinase|nr:histidine kinase [Eubacterium sp.]